MAKMPRVFPGVGWYPLVTNAVVDMRLASPKSMPVVTAIWPVKLYLHQRQIILWLLLEGGLQSGDPSEKGGLNIRCQQVGPEVGSTRDGDCREYLCHTSCNEKRYSWLAFRSECRWEASRTKEADGKPADRHDSWTACVESISEKTM